MPDEGSLIKILLVEDNPGEALLIKEALTEGNPNCQVDVVHSAKGCLESDLSRYGLVLLDYILPDMLGLDVLGRILELRDIPVLMVTGMDTTEIAVGALKIGAYDYIVKTDHYLESLPVAVEKVVEQHRLKSETKRLQEELKASERRYRVLFAESRDALYITARDGEIVEVNQSALDLFGYTREEMIGMDVRKIYVFPEHRPRFQQKIEQNGSVRDYEVTFRKKNGTQMDCLLSSTVRRANDGTVLGYQGIIRDITDRKRAEEEIRKKNKELEDFAQTVSHELKNPLWAIKGYCSAILEDYKENLDEQGRDYLHRAKENAQKMVHLINDLLEYARTGVQTGSLTDVDLSRVLKKVLVELEDQIGEKRIQLITQDLPPVFCDEIRMAQVFTNLIQNSIKFSKDNGSVIEAGCNDRGREYEFYVKDNGIGFDMEDRERIFQIFQRLNHSEGYPGTGIGLSIAKKIVESQGGKIWADSEKGKGATFYFTLPKKPPNG